MAELYVNQRLRIKRDSVIHILKQIPLGNSKIHVNVGQELCPEDLICEGQTPVGYRIIRLAGKLGVNPKNVASYLKRTVGQSIFKGELLAVKNEIFGFKKTIILSPADGVLDSYNETNGTIRLKLLPKSIRVASGVYGIVDRIDQNMGTVTIRTLATIIYGVFGEGKEREGVLKIMGSPDILISSKQIPSNAAHLILVGGSLIFQDGLQELVGLEVAGMISGGINASDYKSMVGGNWNLFKKQWSDVGFSLMVTEGFGSIPIGNDIFSTLKQYDGCFTMINGNRSRIILPSQSSSSIMYIRKTILPSRVAGQGIDKDNVKKSKLDIESISETDVVMLETGQNVRIVGGPFLGVQGKVVGIDQTTTKLPSGIETTMVTVLGKDRKIQVPFVNIEVCQS